MWYDSHTTLSSCSPGKRLRKLEMVTLRCRQNREEKATHREGIATKKSPNSLHLVSTQKTRDYWPTTLDIAGYNMYYKSTHYRFL